MKILLVLALAIACLGLVLMMIGPEKLWNRLGQIEPIELSTWPGRSTPNWALACPDTSDGTFCKSAKRTHTSPSVKANEDAVYEWFITYATGDENPGARAFHDYTESFDAPKQFIQPGSQRSAMRRIGQVG